MFAYCLCTVVFMSSWLHPMLPQSDPIFACFSPAAPVSVLHTLCPYYGGWAQGQSAVNVGAVLWRRRRRRLLQETVLQVGGHAEVAAARAGSPGTCCQLLNPASLDARYWGDVWCVWVALVCCCMEISFVLPPLYHSKNKNQFCRWAVVPHLAACTL